MNDEFHDLEARLAGLRPGGPDAALLARLEGAVHGSLAIQTAEEARFEGALRSSARPAELSAGLLARLEGVVADTPFPVDGNIVLFTRPAPAPAAKRRSWQFRPLAAAAAVAVLGAVSALLIPGGKTAGSGGDTIARNHSSAPVAATPAGFVPAGFGSNVSDASDEGVVWKDNRAHRVVKVVYSDRASFTNSDGKRVEVERPRVEYILVPEKTD